MFGGNGQRQDSSANKCGVICSSFEIIASMLMTSEEFKENKVRRRKEDKRKENQKNILWKNKIQGSTTSTATIEHMTE